MVVVSDSLCCNLLLSLSLSRSQIRQIQAKQDISTTTRSTARITPRAKQPHCLSRFCVVFAEDRLTDEIDRVFALSYMGERCFVVVLTKRSMIFGLSRTILKTREWAGFYKTNKARLSLFFQRMSSSASRNSWGVRGPATRATST